MFAFVCNFGGLPCASGILLCLLVFAIVNPLPHTQPFCSVQSIPLCNNLIACWLKSLLKYTKSWPLPRNTKGTRKRKITVGSLLPYQGAAGGWSGERLQVLSPAYCSQGFVVLTVRGSWLELSPTVLVPWLSTPNTHRSDFLRPFPYTLEAARVETIGLPNKIWVIQQIAILGK